MRFLDFSLVSVCNFDILQELVYAKRPKPWFGGRHTFEPLRLFLLSASIPTNEVSILKLTIEENFEGG